MFPYIGVACPRLSSEIISWTCVTVGSANIALQVSTHSATLRTDSWQIELFPEQRRGANRFTTIQQTSADVEKINLSVIFSNESKKKHTCWINTPHRYQSDLKTNHFSADSLRLKHPNNDLNILNIKPKAESWRRWRGVCSQSESALPKFTKVFIPTYSTDETSFWWGAANSQSSEWEAMAADYY